MSEKKLEPGIVERLRRILPKCGPILKCTLADEADIQDAIAEIERLRSSPPGWREGIEAAAKEIAERITALQQQIAEHNKWGHWLEAAAVERTILELKQRHFAIDSLTPPGDKEKE